VSIDDTIRKMLLYVVRSPDAADGRLLKARGLSWGLRFVPADLVAYACGEQPPEGRS
jgi:hypothetical protein